MRHFNKKEIAILMGTFNGGEYIAEQIESIIAQNNHDWTLYIRDDNSSDDTLSIIRQYCLKNENIMYLEDQLGNIGCKSNFLELLSSVESKYYMFCDQDDVWLADKVELTFQKIKELEAIDASKPALIFTDLQVVDSQLNKIHSSFWEYSKIKPEILKSFHYLSVYNLATGCTMMFNANVKKIVSNMPSFATMHDSYIILKTVNEEGLIGYVTQPTILYRQHFRNVVGAMDYHHNYLLSKIKNIKKVVLSNYENYKMVNHIRRTSVFSYIYYKIKYILIR